MLDPLGKVIDNLFADNFIVLVLFRLFLAFIMGALIGTERSTKRHAAGLRTFIIIILASCIAMILDIYLLSSYFILSVAVIIGVAIMSANTTLFTSKSQIRGLTTSAGLWAISLLGLAIGAGLYGLAILGFIFYVLTLSIVPYLEKYLKNRSNHFEIHLELISASYLKEFSTTLRELGLIIDDIELNPAYLNSNLSVYSISLTIKSEELKKYKTHKEIIKALKTLEYVYFIEEMN